MILMLIALIFIIILIIYLDLAPQYRRRAEFQKEQKRKNENLVFYGVEQRVKDLSSPKIRIKVQKDFEWIVLEGDIRREGYEPLKIIVDKIEEVDARFYVIDMSKVTDVSHDFFNYLSEPLDLALRKKSEVLLYDMQLDVYDKFDVINFHDLINEFDNRKSLLSYMKKKTRKR